MKSSLNNSSSREEVHPSDFAGVVAICLALCITMFAGFLAGNDNFPRNNISSQTCNQHLDFDQCTALRSAKAAEDAASTSKWLLWITAGSFLASTSALAALLFTYKQGQSALNAAREANMISEKNALTQNRAYLFLESVEAKLRVKSPNKVILCVKLKFQNSGLSPALNVKHLTVATLDVRKAYTLASIRSEAGREFDLKDSHWQQDIGAGQDWQPREKNFSLKRGDEIYKLLSDGSVFVPTTIKTEFQYKDVFGNEYRERACFQGSIDFDPSREEYSELERGPDHIYDLHKSISS